MKSRFLSQAADAATKMVSDSTEFAKEKIGAANDRRMEDIQSYGTPEDQMKLIHSTADFLQEKGITSPDVILTLGTGFGDFASTMTNAIRIPYTEIPGFAPSTAPGHKGELIFGEKFGRRVACLSGRWHYYEGYTMKTIVFPLRVLGTMGAKRYILTNAAGWINESYRPGHMMLITDHINMSGDNPLIGGNLDELGVRFPDMTDGYTPELREKIFRKAESLGIELYQGVYAMMAGPSFETPAEIRMLRTMGADAVGMSSVPEAIAAVHMGLELVGITCLANPVAGMSRSPLLEDDVIEASRNIGHDLIQVVDLAIQA